MWVTATLWPSHLHVAQIEEPWVGLKALNSVLMPVAAATFWVKVGDSRTAISSVTLEGSTLIVTVMSRPRLEEMRRRETGLGLAPTLISTSSGSRPSWLAISF